MFGIDVSQFQGNINWEAVKPQIDFAILRLGWIGRPSNHTLDARFERNYYECRRLGIPIGVYVYCYSNSEAQAQDGAVWTLDKLWGKSLQLPVYIDMEDDSLVSLGRDQLTNIVIAYNTVIEQGAFWAGVYANYYWFDNLLNKAEIKRLYTTWIADYTGGGENKYRGEYDMWQYSSTGRITGIDGDVDTNILYRDLIRDIQRAPRLYTVKSGDTLWAIAQRFNTTWQALAKINGLKDPNQLSIGQVLKV